MFKRCYFLESIRNDSSFFYLIYICVISYFILYNLADRYLVAFSKIRSYFFLFILSTVGEENCVNESTLLKRVGELRDNSTVFPFMSMCWCVEVDVSLFTLGQGYLIKFCWKNIYANRQTFPLFDFIFLWILFRVDEVRGMSVYQP